MMMNNIEHIRKLVEKIKAADLFYDYRFGLRTPEELAELYNGCGPDNLCNLPAWLVRLLRWILTGYFEFFEPIFLIHDFDFNFSDRSRTGFFAANDLMFRNGIRLIEHEYPGWRRGPAGTFRKIRRYVQLFIAYRFVDSPAGYRAWID